MKMRTAIVPGGRDGACVAAVEAQTFLSKLVTAR